MILHLVASIEAKPDPRPIRPYTKPFKSFVGNTPPKVKIRLSQTNPILFNDQNIVYEIEVNDEEDGTTLFNEIPEDEVFLEIVYITDTLDLAEISSTSIEYPGLKSIKEMKCFNCHSGNTKLIGPTFLEIRNRYANSPLSLNQLSLSVIKGSTGLWGSLVMPSHPNLSLIRAESMVEWIFSLSEKPLKNYLKGTRGAFPMTSFSSGNEVNAILLIATYEDKGVENKSDTQETGSDRLLIWKE